MTTGEQDLSAQARHDLDAVAATTRQMRLLRMLHGLGPLLMLWGVVLLLGNGVHALLARGHEALLEYWWLALVIVGILLTGGDRAAQAAAYGRGVAPVGRDAAAAKSRAGCCFI